MVKENLSMQRRYCNDFPPATIAQYVTNLLPQSEAAKALTGIYPPATFHKKGAVVVEQITKYRVST